nr:glycosyltransferase [Paenibacillus bouchesdurhonensis]
MIIVQISPYIIPLPGSGGLERVVYNLSIELDKMGHEVYVYAVAGSKGGGIIIPYGHRWDQWDLKEFVLQTMPDDTDVIHDHTHDLIFGEAQLSIPVVSTIHTEWSKNQPVQYPVFVSETKLRQSIHHDRGYFVHNGIDIDEYEFSKNKRDYLLFLGRIDREKGVEDAIKVAELTGMRTIIAGPPWDSELFNELLPRIHNNPNIEYVGEVHGMAKQKLLKNAKWLLFPTACEEQFGLVMIEALACGTPVAAYPRGAVPEVLSGFPTFLCGDVYEMADKVSSPPLFSPSDLRRYVSDRFALDKMAEKYLSIYNDVVKGGD